MVDCRGFSVILKDNDPRLSKSLTLAEFSVAFGVFKNTICEVHPECRQEFDTYLSVRPISDLATTYRGTLLYITASPQNKQCTFRNLIRGLTGQL